MAGPELQLKIEQKEGAILNTADQKDIQTIKNAFTALGGKNFLNLIKKPENKHEQKIKDAYIRLQSATDKFKTIKVEEIHLDKSISKENVADLATFLSDSKNLQKVTATPGLKQQLNTHINNALRDAMFDKNTSAWTSTQRDDLATIHNVLNTTNETFDQMKSNYAADLLEYSTLGFSSSPNQTMEMIAKNVQSMGRGLDPSTDILSVLYNRLNDNSKGGYTLNKNKETTGPNGNTILENDIKLLELYFNKKLTLFDFLSDKSQTLTNGEIPSKKIDNVRSDVHNTLVTQINQANPAFSPGSDLWNSLNAIPNTSNNTLKTLRDIFNNPVTRNIKNKPGHPSLTGTQINANAFNALNTQDELLKDTNGKSYQLRCVWTGTADVDKNKYNSITGQIELSSINPYKDTNGNTLNVLYTGYYIYSGDKEYFVHSSKIIDVRNTGPDPDLVAKNYIRSNPIPDARIVLKSQNDKIGAGLDQDINQYISDIKQGKNDDAINTKSIFGNTYKTINAKLAPGKGLINSELTTKTYETTTPNKLQLSPNAGAREGDIYLAEKGLGDYIKDSGLHDIIQTILAPGTVNINQLTQALNARQTNLNLPIAVKKQIDVYCTALQNKIGNKDDSDSFKRYAEFVILKQNDVQRAINEINANDPKKTLIDKAKNNTITFSEIKTYQKDQFEAKFAAELKKIVDAPLVPETPLILSNGSLNNIQKINTIIQTINNLMTINSGPNTTVIQQATLKRLNEAKNKINANTLMVDYAKSADKLTQEINSLSKIPANLRGSTV